MCAWCYWDVLHRLDPDEILSDMTPPEKHLARRVWKWLIEQIEAEASANLVEDHFRPEVAGPLQELVGVLRARLSLARSGPHSLVGER